MFCRFAANLRLICKQFYLGYIANIIPQKVSASVYMDLFFNRF